MKYIIFEDFSGDPTPIIFPNRIDHADMREQMPYTKALSAGTYPTAPTVSAATANPKPSTLRRTKTMPSSSPRNSRMPKARNMSL